MNKLLGSLALIVIGAAVIYLAYLGYGLLTAHQRQAQQAGNVAVVAGSTKTQTVIGHDAVQTVQGQAESEAAIHAQTQASAKAITAAPGAEVPVQPALYNVALREHCRRASARYAPECAPFHVHGS